ncbi:hypothetical protein QBC42DRAFT_345518 [Cladorrhinum samala]|uniref:Calcofluor white hypersensitive protein n=1 Tax=Cladorrhinum samala TaxID=585594 RepID=A0AAV9HWL4_9PEZI|nr:hypothetical protein QBC42DRAFT_345518 [Cladorrhinum samala]
MAQRSRAPLALGALAAGGIGYYLYSAGGSPRVAEKKAEADAYRASSKIQDHIPSNRSNTAESAEQQGARLGREVGNKLDSAMNTINHDLSKAKRETEAYAKQTKAETMKKIDDFDRTVEEKAAKSKSYLSGWFGSK